MDFRSWRQEIGKKMCLAGSFYYRPASIYIFLSIRVGRQFIKVYKETLNLGGGMRKVLSETFILLRLFWHIKKLKALSKLKGETKPEKAN